MEDMPELQEAIDSVMEHRKARYAPLNRLRTATSIRTSRGLTPLSSGSDWQPRAGVGRGGQLGTHNHASLTMNAILPDNSHDDVPEDSIDKILPSLLSRCEGGLAEVPIETLRQCLQPVLRQLQAIDAMSLLSLQPCGPGQGPQVARGRHALPIHPLISPPRGDDIVRYLHLNEIDGQYSVGVFVFPPNCRIPLHDHPGMCVLSRVLYGQLERRSLDLVRNVPEEQSSWFYRRRPKGSHLARKPRIDVLEAPQTTVLFPFEGNLHEFVAGPHGAAVLDVLLPPYDDDHDCTFYKVEDGEDSEICWLVPIEQPKDFHCIGGQHGSLGA